MLLIYTPIIANRVKYIFQLIFTEILGVEIKLITQIEEFNSFNGAKINYSQNQFKDELFFQSTPLLFETGINEQKIDVFDWNGTKALFSTDRNAALPFDPFAASFYLASRYEEYLPYLKDVYGRFNPKGSCGFQNGFLQQPVINIYAQKIKEIIHQKHPDFHFPVKSYQYISTIDIDNAYAYLGKGIVRILGAYAKALISLNFQNMLERTKVLTKLQKDPYDTYEYLAVNNKKYQLNPIYFFLIGNYGKYDKNAPFRNKKYQRLIKSLSNTKYQPSNIKHQHITIGLHPSYASNKSSQKLEKELTRLSGLLNKNVTKSRQHFIKLSFPDTYRNLIDIGITDDYTMGYPSEIGFRAGICTPFYFYDLKSEKHTKLKIHPFAVMDATLKSYLKIQPEDAISHIQPLIDEVKAVNGTFICIWHNESLSDNKQWKGWKNVYEQMLEVAIDKNGS